MLDVLSFYDIETVTGNKELQIMHACRTGYTLSDPHLFLRQLNYLVTDRTMLIKGAGNLRIFELHLECATKETLNKITKLIQGYADNFGLENLAKQYGGVYIFDEKFEKIAEKSRRKKGLLNDIKNLYVKQFRFFTAVILYFFFRTSADDRFGKIFYCSWYR